jgi:hypothetical protein
MDPHRVLGNLGILMIIKNKITLTLQKEGLHTHARIRTRKGKLSVEVKPGSPFYSRRWCCRVVLLRCRQGCSGWSIIIKYMTSTQWFACGPASVYSLMPPSDPEGNTVIVNPTYLHGVSPAPWPELMSRQLGSYFVYNKNTTLRTMCLSLKCGRVECVLVICPCFYVPPSYANGLRKLGYAS